MRPQRLCILVTILVLLSVQLPDGASRPGGIDNVPNGCNCHSVSPSPEVEITLEGMPTRFVANTNYTLTITATGGAASVEDPANLAGFNLWIERGTLSSLDDAVRIFSANEAGHTTEGNDQRSWTLNWTAPADDSLNADYRLHVNTVNGDGSASDADMWNRKLGATVGVNGTVPEPVSALFLYGVPILLIGFSGWVYVTLMKKKRPGSDCEE
jgi:hypothetical protein